LLKNYPYKERVLLHFENASIPRSSDHCARDSRRVRFPPKIIQIRIERGETIKERYQCITGERSLVFCFGWWSDRCWSVKGAETARKGFGDVEGPKRVRQEEESRARPRGPDIRIPDGRFAKNQTPECGVRFHTRISTVGPRNVQVSRDIDRPVMIKARVIE
jgi:hypothetical protein